jgi:uncharacterized protein
MSAIHALQPIYAIVAFAVGLLVGMTGVGGGSLMTPALILLFGVQPATAVGTDLLQAAVTKSAGSVVHGFNRTIDWRLASRLAAGSIPATLITLAALGALDVNSPAGRILINAVLTLALLVTAIVLVLRERIAARYAARLGRLSGKQIAVLTIAGGAIVGTLVSISSVGAGVLGSAALILLYPKMPAARIVGTEIAHAVPLTLVAGIGHWFLGSVDLQVLASLLLGSVPGILLGSYVAVRIPETALRLVLAAALIAVATKLSFGLIPPSGEVVTAKTIAPPSDDQSSSRALSTKP